jgi:hypothetical protein
MRSIVTKTASGMVMGAAILSLLTGATCYGAATARINPNLPAGQCLMGTPFGKQTDAHLNDVLQIADGNNVNDFIQCHALELVNVGGDDFLVEVSEPDAVGHGFVEDSNGEGGKFEGAVLVNLSR